MIGDFQLGTEQQPPDAGTRPADQAPAPAERAHAQRPEAQRSQAQRSQAERSEAERSQAERSHAARVEAHRSATGWGPEQAVRMASLTARIARAQRQPPVGPGPALVAGLVAAADLALAAIAVTSALTGAGARADAGVLILLAMFVPTVWAAWTLTRLVQRRRERGDRAELDRLRLDRGCGDPSCTRCAG